MKRRLFNPWRVAWLFMGIHSGYVALIVLLWLIGHFQNDESWVLAFVPFNLGILIQGDLPRFLTVDQSKLIWAAYLLVTGGVQWAVLGYGVGAGLRLAQVTRRGIPGTCRACGYDLRGTPCGGPCPECGEATEEVRRKA